MSQDPKGQIRTGLLHAGIAKRLSQCSQLGSGFYVCSLCLPLFNLTNDFALAFESMRSDPGSESGSPTASFFAHSCLFFPCDSINGGALLVVPRLMCTQVTLSQMISAFRLDHSQCSVCFMSQLPSAEAELVSGLEPLGPRPVHWRWFSILCRLQLPQGSAEDQNA